MATGEVEEAYRRLWPMIRAKCARMLRDPSEAEDVAQETFVRLWQKRIDRELTEVVAGWIYRTATHLAIDRMRKRKLEDERRPEVELSPHLEALVGARTELDRIARTVPKKELSAALLVRLDGLSHLEVGRVLGISERSVRRLLTSFDARIEKRRAIDERRTS